MSKTKRFDLTKEWLDVVFGLHSKIQMLENENEKLRQECSDVSYDEFKVKMALRRLIATCDDLGLNVADDIRAASIKGRECRDA
jgi:hypothetical protein